MNEIDQDLPDDEELEDDGLAPAEELDDRDFNPHRVPIGSWAKTLVEEAIRDVLAQEERKKTRVRARRAVDLKTFEHTVSAILCDVVHRQLSDPGEWITVTFDKSVLGCGGRYRATALNTKLPDIVRALDARRWIELEVGYHEHPFRQGRPSKQTRIRAGETLTRLYTDNNTIRLSDYDLEDSEEVVILRRRRESHRDRGGDTDYPETEQTTRYREDLRRINKALRDASLSFIGTGHNGREVDLGDRRLRRIFNDGSFERGGRLYGGFWQGLKSEDRARGLRLNGQPTVTLDYGQTALRILYGMAGIQPTWEDGYQVPGLEGHREGVKTLLNAMLNRDTPLQKFPKGVRQLFPRNTPAWQAVRLIETFHPPLKTKWRPRVGMELMFRESQILVEVLLRLLDLKIVALPVHDALIVSQANQGVTQELMLEVFHTHTSIEAKVGISR
ncbi:hypothetical protein [uncultured Nevskia sp.]|uniref:hypothetical protein n=1 Tax=uncultured Nevskia sp. TaxID=228950 RepID=UPI0025DD6B85|nr:hypothetical protein [uncultured Nevskia sp.]